MRFHSPPSFFIGYFRRRSPCACSRTAAPLAQCAPRLNGLSHPGSWPVQTPSCTSATTVQPTEQCVQTDLTVSTAAFAAVAAVAWSLFPQLQRLRLNRQSPNQTRAKMHGDQQWFGPHLSGYLSAGGVSQPHWSFSLALFPPIRVSPKDYEKPQAVGRHATSRLWRLLDPIRTERV